MLAIWHKKNVLALLGEQACLPDSSSPLSRFKLLCSLIFFCVPLLMCNLLHAQTLAGEIQAGKSESKKDDKSGESQAGKGKKQAAADSSEGKAEEQGPVTAIVGATVHTMTSSGVIENATVLIQGKRVLDVGASVEIPEGAKVVRADGYSITPGWIDAQSSLWLTADSRAVTASDGSLNVLDGMDPFAKQWKEVVASGVTSVYVQPSNSSTLGGFGVALSVVPDQGEIRVLQENVALQASLGSASASNRSRAQQLDRIKKVFAAAKDYKKKWEAYNKYLKEKAAKEKSAKKSGKGDAKKPSADASKSPSEKPVKSKSSVRKTVRPSGLRSRVPAESNGSKTPAKGKETSTGKGSAESDSEKKEEKKAKPPEKPEKDPVKELLIKAIDGELPLRMVINHADDFYFFQKLKKEYGDLQFVLSGADRLGSAAANFKGLAYPLVLGPWTGSSPDDKSRVEAWSDLLEGYAGGLAITSADRSGLGSRALRYHVAAAVASGVSAERALAAVTTIPARLLGLEKELGQVKAGYQADLVMFSGNPLDTSVPVAKVWVNGKIVSLNSSAEVPSVNAEAAELASATDVDLSNLPNHFLLRTSRCMLPSGVLAAREIEIEEGMIKAVREIGPDSNGSGLAIFDLGDSVVSPGVFSLSSSLGLSSQIDPSSIPDASYVVAADAFDLNAQSVRALARDGLQHVLLTPGNGNPVAGIASLVELGPSHQVVNSSSALKFSLVSASRSPNRFPSSLAGQLQFVEQTLGGQLLTSRLVLPEAVAARLNAARKDRLSAVAEGKLGAIFQVASDQEIRGALNLIERFKLKAALVGPRQLRPFMKRLKALQVSVVAKPEDAKYQWFYDDFVAAEREGIEVGFAGDNATEIRKLASYLVSAGMGRAKAQAVLCHGLQGVASIAGVKEGMPASFVMWSDSPLNMAATIRGVLSDGKLVGETESP